MGSWEAAVANARGKKVGNGHNVHGYIAQWLERLTADQQVPGSNPGVPFFDEAPCTREELCISRPSLHELGSALRDERSA